MSSIYDDLLRKMAEEMNRQAGIDPDFYSRPFPGAYTKAKSPMRRATPEMFHDSYNSVPHVKLKDPEQYRGDNPDVLVSANPGRWKVVNGQKYIEDAKWRMQLVNPEWETTHEGTRPVRKGKTTFHYSTPPFYTDEY